MARQTLEEGRGGGCSAGNRLSTAHTSGDMCQEQGRVSDEKLLKGLTPMGVLPNPPNGIVEGRWTVMPHGSLIRCGGWGFFPDLAVQR